jgi:hypothetical protein
MMEARMMAEVTNDLDLTTVTSFCADGKHGRCKGSVYAWADGDPNARLVPCSCGCGCSREVPVSRPSAARTRARQIAEAKAKRENG